jgi:hypothetical protein
VAFVRERRAPGGARGGSTAWFGLLEARSFNAEGIAAAAAWLAAAREARNALATGRALVHLGLFQRFGAQTANALASLNEAIDLLGAVDAPATSRTRAPRAPSRCSSSAASTRPARRASGDRDRRAAGRTMRSSPRAAARAGSSWCSRDAARRTRPAAARARGGAAHRQAIDAAAAHNNLALAENHLGNFRAAEAGYQARSRSGATCR